MSELMVLSNPRRKRAKHRRHNPESFAKRSRAARRGAKHRRHHRRHNPESYAKRSRAARLGARHRRRRNPISSSSELSRVLMPAAAGAIGALGLNVALSYVTFLPATLKTGYGRAALQLATALGIGYAGPKMGLSRSTANAVAAGIGVIALYDVIVPLVQSKFPSVQLGERVNPSVGLLPSPIKQPGFGERVMQQYLPQTTGTGGTG